MEITIIDIEGNAEENSVYIFLDTCVWLDVFYKYPELLAKLEDSMSKKDLKLIINDIVLEEWGRGIIRKINEYVLPYEKSKKDLEEIGVKRMASSERVRKTLVVKQERIEKIMATAEEIIIPEISKQVAVDRVLQKIEPFHIKGKNGLADDLIFCSVLEFSRENPKKEILFVSSNWRDFSVSDSDKKTLHSALQKMIEGLNIHYYMNLGEALNNISAELVSKESIQDIDRSIEERMPFGNLDFIMPAGEAGVFREMYKALNKLISIPEDLDSFEKRQREMSAITMSVMNMTGVGEKIIRDVMPAFVKIARDQERLIAGMNILDKSKKEDDDTDDNDEDKKEGDD